MSICRCCFKRRIGCRRLPLREPVSKCGKEAWWRIGDWLLLFHLQFTLNCTIGLLIGLSTFIIALDMFGRSSLPSTTAAKIANLHLRPSRKPFTSNQPELFDYSRTIQHLTGRYHRRYYLAFIGLHINPLHQIRRRSSLLCIADFGFASTHLSPINYHTSNI